MSKCSVIKTPNTVMHEQVLKIQQFRKKSKISQLELAKRSGVSFGSVKRFEITGLISLESLLKLAYFLIGLMILQGYFRLKLILGI